MPQQFNCVLFLYDDQSFSCSRGRAYLFSKVVNVTLGTQVERLMMSGLHTVEDIFCCCCGQIVGWKYVVAHEKSETYKEGKFVLERWRIVDDVEDELNLDAASSSDSENTQQVDSFMDSSIVAKLEHIFYCQYLVFVETQFHKETLQLKQHKPGLSPAFIKSFHTAQDVAMYLQRAYNRHA